MQPRNTLQAACVVALVNSAVLDLVNGWAGRSGLLDSLMKFSAVDLVYLVVPLGLLLWLAPGPSSRRALRQRVWITVMLSIAVALLVQALAGAIHTETRPFVARSDVTLLIAHSPDNSFPSSHATVAFAVAGALVWWRWPVGLIALAVACLVAFARVFVGVHWPSDVLAGAAIGICTGTLAARTTPLWIPLQAKAAALLPPWLVAAP